MSELDAMAAQIATRLNRMLDLIDQHATTREYDRADWRRYGNCYASFDPDFFKATKDARARAKRWCHDCLVIDECRGFALRMNPDLGVWGGRTIRELKRDRREGRLV